MDPGFWICSSRYLSVQTPFKNNSNVHSLAFILKPSTPKGSLKWIFSPESYLILSLGWHTISEGFSPIIWICDCFSVCSVCVGAWHPLWNQSYVKIVVRMNQWVFCFLVQSIKALNDCKIALRVWRKMYIQTFKPTTLKLGKVWRKISRQKLQSVKLQKM